MAIYDLPATGPDSLNSLLQADGIDAATRQAILTALSNAGDTNPISVQVGGYPPFTPDANGNLPEVLILPNPISSVDTSADPNLAAIVGIDANITVTGSNNVLVATGGADDTVRLNDTGNDTVLTAGGNDTI